MTDINWVTVGLIGAFLLPVLIGAFEPFSRYRVKYSISSLFNSVEFLLSIFLSFYLTKKIFFEHDNGIYKWIYDRIPLEILNSLKGKDILTYLTAGLIILLVVLLVMRLFSIPLYNLVFEPLSDGLCSFIERRSTFFKKIFGMIWQLPRSVYIVFILGMLLNFYSYYFTNPFMAKWMNESPVYQSLYNNALNPVLNSSLAKKIPVIVNDSFQETFGKVLPRDNGSGEPASPIPGIRVIEYFNGVTLEEAIKSSPEIDATARKIVGNEHNSRKKAQLLYKWITQNIRYDFEKAERISKDTTGVQSGSRIAFETGKGICFDYSCLYISMCRAVGVKVRLITGLAYSGISWGDHAWNQVYSVEDSKWINVDTTFGTTTNYFDKPNFGVDHKYAEVQGEW